MKFKKKKKPSSAEWILVFWCFGGKQLENHLLQAGKTKKKASKCSRFWYFLAPPALSGTGRVERGVK